MQFIEEGYTEEGYAHPVVILAPGETVTVELSGGNGETFTISDSGKSVVNEDGFNITAAAYRAGW